MQISTWLWHWLDQRQRRPAPADPLANFAKLTVERLEDRRVLSATLASGVDPNVVVEITGNETVTVSVDGSNNLVITDTDGGTADIVIALADIDSLTFNGDGDAQAIIFGGTNPIDLAALNITTGIEDVSFQQDVIADEGGVLIQALNNVTFSAGADLLVTAGDVSITAANDLLMDATSSITVDDLGDSLSVSLTAGDDLTTGTIQAGLGITLDAGTSTLDGSLLQVDGGITANTGNVTITGADDITFSVGGDVTASNGSLTITAGFNDLDGVGAIELHSTLTAQQAVQLSAITGIDDGMTGFVAAAELEILGNGAVLLDNNHAVATVAANLNGALTYHSANGFTVGTVNGTTGITLTQAGAALELATASGSIGLAQSVTTDGFQNYASAVELLADVSLNSGSGDIQFAHTVDGSFALSITGGNNVTFAGAVGSTAELAAVDLNVSGTVTVSSSMQLGQDETHAGTFTVFANEFVLNGSIDTQDADPFGGGGVLIFANIITLGGRITTDEGSVDFIGDVFLVANSVIETESGSVGFHSAIDGVSGGENLTVTSTAGGVILVSGAIGANVAIGALAFSSTAPAGLITLQNAVIATNDVTLSAEFVLLDGAIDTTAAAVGAGHVTITSTFLTTLTKNITTSDGDITLNGFTRIDTSLTLQTDSGDVAINGALDSNELGGAPIDGLTIIATLGNVTIQADVGTGATPGSDPDGLAFLDITAGGALSACGTWIIATSVTFTSAVFLCGDLSITAAGDVTFEQTIDADGIAASTELTIQADNVTLMGTVGAVTPVESLVVTTTGTLIAESTITAGTVHVTGTAELGGNVTTTGEQHYTGAVLLTNDVTFSAVDTDADGEGIDFGSALNGGGKNLTIIGGARFAAAVTNVNDLLADHIDTEATLSAGTVHVTGASDLGGNITTSGIQQYDGAVLLTANVIATSTGNANITYGSTVNGPQSLTVNTGGVTRFAGIVGGSTALTALTTNAAGSTVINTTSVRAGTIDFNDAVILEQSATVQGTTAVTFHGSVQGSVGTENLLVISGNTASFLGTITQLENVTINANGQTLIAGNVTITGALSTNAAGLTKIDTASISAGTVQFSDAVELCQDLAITAGRITFGSTLNEAAGATGSNLELTITNPSSATGDITLTGAVGGVTALDSVTITTANDVTFSSTVRLEGDLHQQNGTGTTTFNGTSGTGIGGQLIVSTNAIILNTADVVTVGAIQMTTQGALTLNANAGLNAGASTITLLVSQNGAGGSGFTQSGSAVIRTTNETADAVRIAVVNASVALGQIQAGTVGGVVSITAGQFIRDNLSGEAPNLIAHAAALRAGTTIGNGNDINTDVNQLAFSGAGGVVNITNVGDLTVTTIDGLSTSLASGGGTLIASGSLTIAMNTQVGGVFNFIAGDDVAGINDLIIAADISHLTGLGQLYFQAGDDIIHSAGTIRCLSTVVGGLSKISFVADHEASGADGDRGGITQTGGMIVTKELLIQSFDAVTMNQGNDVDILAGFVTGAGQSFTFRDINDLTIYRITGLGGNAVGLTTNGGDVTLNVGGHLILGGNGEDILAAGATVSITVGNGFNEGGSSTITAGQLVLLGTGEFALNEQNNVDVLAANINGNLAYTDVNGFSVGTVAGTVGITSSDDDIKLAITAGNLTINDDIQLGTGDLTLDVNGSVTQTAGDSITAGGLLLLGTGTITLDDVGNDITTLAAGYNGTITFTDANTLIIGTVTDDRSGMFARGLTTSNDDVQLTVLAGSLTIGTNIPGAQFDDVNVGTGNLTLIVNAGNITQTTNNNITAHGLQLRGTGAVTLNNAGNNVNVLAANWDGTLAYTDANGLTIGTVIDNAAASNFTTTGITTTGDDVKLTVLANGLVIDDDISLGSGDLTLNVVGAVTQNANDTITAHGLQVFGSGTVALNDAGNNVDVLAASYNGTISYTDANALTVGTVIDDASGMSAVGVTTSNDDVKLSVLSNGLLIDDDVSLGAADLTLNVVGSVTQSAGDDLSLRGLQLLGTGTITLTNVGNNVQVIAANYNGTIAYTDSNGFTIGTVTDEASAMTTAGITTSGDDVLLTAVAGGIGLAADVTLGSGVFGLNVAGSVVQTAGSDITASGLQLLGSGSVVLENSGNNVATLAANFNGTISYVDANGVTVGTVTNTAVAPIITTVGITTSNDHVRLQVLGGPIAINAAVALGSGNLTLQNNGAITEGINGTITAHMLDILGTGTVTLTSVGNNVNVLSASRNGTIAYTDANALIIGGAMGVRTSGDDVYLTVLAGGLSMGDNVGDVQEDDIRLGAGNLTLNVNGAITQQAFATDIVVAGLQLLGTGTTVLTNVLNQIGVFAANYDGAIVLNSAYGFTVGTVTDHAEGSLTTTVGITTSNDDVMLSASDGLVIDDDISLGQGDLTIYSATTVLQNAGDDITARGLQLLGNATYTLTSAGNDVDIFAADFDGSVEFTDIDDLLVGTVTDELTGSTSVGISQNVSSIVDTVRLNTGGLLTIGSGAGQDIILGNGTVVLNSAAGIVESAGSIISAQQLLLLGSGSFSLDEANQVAVLAADINGSLHYHSGGHLDVNVVNGVVGISTGNPGNGGDVTLLVDGEVRIISAINTQGGTGGVITVSGGVLNAALIAGAGNITILSNSQDLVINANQSSATTMNLSATRDVIINAVVTTTGAGADVLVTADSNTNGVGGVRVTTAGQIVSADEIVLKGSDLFVTMGVSDAIWIEADGANDQLLAAGNITLQNQATIPTTADVLIDGRIRSTGGDITIQARDEILARSAIIAETGSVTFGRSVVLTGALQVTAGGNVHFTRTVNDDGNAGTSSALSVTAAGTTIFTGAVGNLAALSSLVTNGGGITEICGGSVTTTGVQVYADAVVLCANTTLTSTAGGSIVFQSTVNGDGIADRSLIVNTAGITDFQGAVGNTQALAGLRTDAPGTTQIGGGSITTVGLQTFSDDVLLTNGAVLTSTASGTIQFLKTVNGPHSLTVNTSGLTSFQLEVGNTQALASLTTDVGGTTRIAGGLVRTTGTQTFGDAVTLAANTLFTSTATSSNGANITFQSTVNTAGHNTTIDAGTQGELTVAGALTGGGTLLVQRVDSAQFAAVTVDTLTIQAATTSVTFHGPVAVTNTAMVNSSGTITQENTLLAGQNVSYTAAGAIAVQGTLTAGNDVTLISSAGSITATAPITATNGDLTVTAGITILATHALTAATSVVLTSANGTTLGINGDVCTTAIGGFVTINGPLMTAADILTNNGAITLTGPVTLTGNVMWDSDRFETGGANVTVNSTVATAGNNLTIDAGPMGNLSLQNTVSGGGHLLVEQGSQQAFAAINVDQLTIQEATTSVLFTAPVTVTNSVSVNSLGTITQNSTGVAGQNVSYTAVGTIAVNGALTAGNNVALNSSTASINLTAPVTATNGNLTAQAATTVNATQALNAATGVVLIATNGITLGVNGDVTTTAVGGFVTITGPLTTAADILTNNGAITLTGPATLTGAVLWDSDRNETGGAKITVQGTVATAGHNLTIDAGSTGDLTFQSSLTGGGNLVVEQGNEQLFQAAVSVDNLTIEEATTSVTFAAPVTVTQSLSVNSLGTIAQNNSVVAGQNLRYTAGGAITVLNSITAGNQASLIAGTVLTLTEAADIATGVGGVILTGSQIMTAAEITTNSGNVSVTGAVTLMGDVTIDTGASGALLVTGTVDAQTAFAPSLFLSTGTGNITVTGNIGSVGPLNALEITDARNVTFGGAVTANHLLQQSGVGTTTIVGAVNTFDVQGLQLTTQSIQFAAGTSSIDSHGQIITLTADAITLPTTFTRAVGSTVTLQTLNITTSIGIENASQDLNFTDAQLDTIDTQNLIIGSITQTAGIKVGNDGSVTLNENLTLLTGGTIGVFGVLSLDGMNHLRLEAGDDIQIDGSVATAAGNIQLLADDDLTMGANGLVTSATGNVLVRADADGNSNGTGGGITMTDGAKIVVGTGTLTLLADESIVLGQLVSSNTTANAIAVTSQHGGIVDGGDSTGPNIVTTSNTAIVTLSAEAGIGSQSGLAANAALETQVNLLVITNSVTGNIGINEVNAVTLLGVEQNGPGSITLTAGGTMTVALGGAGVQSQGGAITLVTTGAASDLVLNAAVNSRGGNVTMQVGNNLIQAASAPITTHNGNLAATVGGALFMEAGALADAGSGTAALQAVGNVTLGQVRTTNASGNAVLIRSTTGGIIDGGDLLGANLVANAAGAIVTLQAAAGIGSTLGAGANAALETEIHSLVASNTTAGNITLSEADALLIRSVVQSATGNVTVQSVGDLTLVAGQPGVNATSGNVTLAATAAASNLLIESTVQTNSGAILVNAANNLTMTTAAQILSQSGNVTVNADADNTLGGAGGALTMMEGAKINAGTGNVALKADGDITIGQVITTATVSLTSTSAGIVDGGDIDGADIIASNLAIRAVTGVGNSNALETAVDQLAVENTLAGGIRIDNNTGGLLTIGAVDGVTGITNTGANAAIISVVNDGAVTVSGAVRNATGGDIFLQATNNGGNDDDLVVNAVIAATNGNGNIELQAGHNLLINDTGSAVDISVVNGGKVLGNAVGNVTVGPDVVIQSGSGAISALNPELINVSTPQITALGEGTIFMTVQRPFEVGTVIVIDWGDGTIETFVVTEANQQNLVFKHIYTAPPNPLNPAEDIPLKMTVLAPGFTTGARPSPTTGTQLVANGSYDPNIQFFANGETVTPASFGPLNETVLTTVFKTPGDGLASFAFDLTPEVEYLTFPEQPKVDASLLATPQPPAQVNTLDVLTARAEELLQDERVVLLEVFTPDGKLQERVILSEDVLDNLDGVVRGLPDGHYRFVLREAGETQTRLLQEFDVRQGRIAGGNDNAGDRPPSMMTRPVMPSVPSTDATPPADALHPENGDSQAAAVDSADETPFAWSGWRARRAWREACASFDKTVAMDHGIDAADGEELLMTVAADSDAVTESGFGRSARLLRKYGMF